MVYKVKLKNSFKCALISEEVYNHIQQDEYLQSLDFLNSLRLHSNGYAFFQKNFPKEGGGYKNLTIYLHRYIAENFIQRPDSDGRKLYVSISNGNKLDCRLENLEWVTRSVAVRNTKKMFNSTGYRGVGKERNKYRAVIYRGKEKFDLGFFDSAEEAAEAYNKKSVELFGPTRSLNVIGEPREKYDPSIELERLREQVRKERELRKQKRMQRG